jgi:hypothetical protein
LRDVALDCAVRLPHVGTGPPVNYHAQGAGHLSAQLKTKLRRRLLLVPMVTNICSIISEVTVSPPVRASYPSSHSSPFRSLFFVDGYCRNSSRALILFRVLTTSPIEQRGGNDGKRWTWSSATIHFLSVVLILLGDLPDKISTPLAQIILREHPSDTLDTTPGDLGCHRPHDWFFEVSCGHCIAQSPRR